MKHGITANAYAPGIIHTPLGEFVLSSIILFVYISIKLNLLSFAGRREGRQRRHGEKSRHRQSLHSAIFFPNFRYAQLFGLPPDAPDAEPEVVASIVSYLAKPESYFINGEAARLSSWFHKC